jgi:hypothetical protein
MSLGFSTIKDKGNSIASFDPDVLKVTTLNLLPKFGYFIIDNLAVGLNMYIGTSTDKPKSGGKYNTTSFGLGPFKIHIPVVQTRTVSRHLEEEPGWP